MKTPLARTILIAGFALLSAHAAHAQDKIHLKGSGTLEGKVTSMTFREVQYEDATAGGIPHNQDAGTIREIVFDRDRSWDFTSGEDAFQKGDYAEAKDRFERVRKDQQRASQPMRQTAFYYLIRCHLEAGEYREAVEVTEALRREFPESFYLRDSFRLQYEAARAMGQSLDPIVSDFQRMASQKGMARDWEKYVDLLKADAAEIKRDFRTARSLYDKYAMDRDPEAALDARLGQLRSLSGMQEWSSLRSKAEGFIGEATKAKDSIPGRLLLAAHVAKGKAALGEKKNKEALLDLMRSVLLIAPTVPDAPREIEEAYAYAAIACARFASGQKQSDTRHLYRERAERLKAELMRYFKRSSYEEMVGREIAAIPK